MARRKVGTLTWSADGSRVKIQVMRGYRSDGSRRVLTRTLHDVSADEAEAEAVRMAAELGASDLAGDSMTLAEFYRGVFRDSPSNRGRPRTKGTLRGYDYAMDHHVLPTLGDVAVGRVTHDQVAAVIRAAASPKNCKTVLRAVLMAAYDMGYVAERPLQRRVPTPRARAEQVQPWDRLGVARRPQGRGGLAPRAPGLPRPRALGPSQERGHGRAPLRPVAYEALRLRHRRRDRVHDRHRPAYLHGGRRGEGGHEKRPLRPRGPGVRPVPGNAGGCGRGGTGRRAARVPFNLKVVGSNPTGPTMNLYIPTCLLTSG